jgi:hypothetical protein
MVTEGTEVPEPSEKLVGLYHEIWTEVDKDFRPRNVLDGLPFNPRDHLMWTVDRRFTRSLLVDLFTRRHQRGTQDRDIPRQLVDEYIDQLEREAGTSLDP